jgi:eukaryotic-like serine/threonine-protein kinase
MNRVRVLIREIHRRSLWQVLGIYAAGSWIGYQIILALTHGLALPDWVLPFAIVLFLIGLPIVVATAFVNEGVPGLPSRAPLPLPELELELADEVRGPEADTAAPRRSRRPHPLTWRRALGAGAVAFVVLGVSAGTYSGLRSAGIGPMGSLLAKGALSSDDAVLLADFAGAAEDSLLTAALTEALRIDLGQSRTLRLIQPTAVRSALGRMQRDPDSRLDEPLAREVAVRENVKAVLAGNVSRVAGSWVITARLLVAEDGTELGAFRETARDSTALLGALDRLSRSLRKRVGESLRDVRASEPLAQVTTSSLEALRLYTQARRMIRGTRDEVQGLRLLEEALAIDSAFASAHRGVAVALFNRGRDRDRMMDAATRAYRFSERLTESERLHATLFYHFVVRGDIDAAVLAGERLVERYPTDHAALNNLGLLAGRQRDFARSAELYRRSFAIDSSSENTLRNYFFALGRTGEFDRIPEVLAEYRRRFPAAAPDVWEALFQAARGDYAAAIAQARRALPELNQTQLVPGYQGLAGYAMASGRIREGYDYYARLQQVFLSGGNTYQYLARAAVLTQLELRVLERGAREALKHIDHALAERPLAAVPAANRPYAVLAAAYAEAGDVARARALLADYEREVPADEQSDDGSANLAMAVGHIALAEGRWDDAVRHFHTAYEQADRERPALAALSDAFHQAGMQDSAAVYALRFVETPMLDAFWDDQLDLVRLLERLGRYHESRGETGRALEAWARITVLWQDADAELQPRVRAAQARIRALRPG